jgi:hypothetical protein
MSEGKFPATNGVSDFWKECRPGTSARPTCIIVGRPSWPPELEGRNLLLASGLISAGETPAPRLVIFDQEYFPVRDVIRIPQHRSDRHIPGFGRLLLQL